MTLFGIVDKAPDTLRHMQWPLVPSWSKEIPKYNTSNARSEDVDTKPVYRNLLGKCYCKIAVGGFYEWEGQIINPYYCNMADDSLMKYAGIF